HSMGSFRVVCRFKTLMLRTNHTPAPFLPRSNGDMPAWGPVAAGESGATEPRACFGVAGHSWRARRGGSRGGGGVGGQVSVIDFGGIVRVGALAACCAVLAHCSGPFSSKEYSPRVVEEGEPVPKGGGSYRIGKPYSVNGRTYVPAESPRYRAEGVASWYG